MRFLRHAVISCCKVHAVCGVVLALATVAACSRRCHEPRHVVDVPDVPLLVDHTAGDNRLLIYSLGSPLSIVRLHCVRGRGLITELVNRRANRVIFERSSGEINWDVIVDYSDLRSGVLRYTECTWDPRDFRSPVVPFVLTTVSVRTDGSWDTREEIVLKPEAADPKRIRRLEAEMVDAYQREDIEAFKVAAAHLRNVGVGNPERVLAIFNGFRDRPLTGAFAESLNAYEDEVRRVVKVEKTDSRYRNSREHGHSW